jgi:predicted permease
MHDLREAVRALRSTPAACAVAVLTLALGIGANTAIFSILNSLTLRTLPVRDPASLVAIADGTNGQDAELFYPVWTAVRDRRLLDSAAAWAKDGLSEVRDGQTLPVNAIWASGRFFDTLGVRAIRGRTLGERDDIRGGGPDGPAAVVSAAFWQRRYGGDPDVVGRTLVLDRVPFTVVGVASPEFFGLEVGMRVDVILPLEAEPMLGRTPSRLRLWPWLHVIGRIPPNSSRAAAAAAVLAAQPEIRRDTMPEFERAEDRNAYLSAPWTIRPAAAGSSRLRARYGAALVSLLWIAAFVLVIGCVNIANLQLARAAARRHDLSVRAALGASPWRLIRPVLIENLLIAGAGTALGLLFAAWAGPLLVAQLATWASTPSLDLPLDLRVLGATTIAMVGATVLFGAAPVLLARRTAPIAALQQRTEGTRRRIFGARDGLVALQIAVCLVLVFGAHLFIRSFASLTLRDLGFDRRPVLVAVVEAQRSRVAPGDRLALFERLRERAAATPGAHHAAISMSTPLGSAGVRLTPEVSLAASDIGRDIAPRILTNLVSPEWFVTYGTRIVAGRDFTTGDRVGAPPVAIVNEAFARRFFGAGSVIGRVFASTTPMGSSVDQLTVVGLVENAAFTSVRTPVEPTVYRPIAQAAGEQLFTAITSVSVSVRAAAGIAPAALHSAVAQELTAVDHDLAVMPIDVKTQLDAYYVRERLLGLVSGFFGVLGLALAAVGLYGVSAQSATARRREIGIRIALGASRGRVVRLVIGRLAGAGAIGVAAGLLASVWLGRTVEGLLYGVTARDPLALFAAAVTLLVTAAVAGWLPARRAARTAPMIVLRES